MPDVPRLNLPKPKLPNETTFYCFAPGTPEADKQHDIEQIDKFVEHIKAKRMRRRR